MVQNSSVHKCIESTLGGEAGKFIEVSKNCDVKKWGIGGWVVKKIPTPKDLGGGNESKYMT